MPRKKAKVVPSAVEIELVGSDHVLPNQWNEGEGEALDDGPVEGEVLVELVSQLKGRYEPSQFARLFGFTQKGNKPNMAAFHAALVEGAGLLPKVKRGPKKQSMMLRVTPGGHIIVNKSHVEKQGFGPGALFSLLVENREGKCCFVLVPS